VGAAGLAAFHPVDDPLRAARSRLIVHRPRRLARRALAITGLDTVLPIRPTTARNLTCDISTVAELSSPTEAAAVNQPARRPPDAHHHTDRPEAKMISSDTATTNYASGQSPSGDSAATEPVLPWCGAARWGPPGRQDRNNQSLISIVGGQCRGV
jgi:hypothetical protein